MSDNSSKQDSALNQLTEKQKKQFFKFQEEIKTSQFKCSENVVGVEAYKPLYTEKQELNKNG